MELRLKGYGTIEITNATLVDGGDILIESADNFQKLAEFTDYEITEVCLTDTEYGWGLVAWLNLPEDEWYENDAVVLDIENQDDVCNLNARL